RADGIDLDEAMIEIARKKALALGSPAAFGVADIRSLSANALYQGVYCIGNTLAHLTEEDEIRDLVKKMYFALSDTGTAVIQIVNYDRVLDGNVTALPSLENAGRTLTRKYRRDGGLVRFQTVLTYQDESYRADTPLYPLRARTLQAILTSAGFRQVALYGDFDLRPFDPAQSFALVARGVK
ncbi:MAG: methyltransferase domain-containing protein, partial [Bacillota bacterium]|nr:methyltransferase domain-containing protein [Bacillota bacterium]